MPDVALTPDVELYYYTRHYFRIVLARAMNCERKDVPIGFVNELTNILREAAEMKPIPFVGELVRSWPKESLI